MTLQEKKILLICSYYKIVTLNKMRKECHKLKNMINISKNYRKMQFIWMRVMFFVAIIVGFMMLTGPVLTHLLTNIELRSHGNAGHEYDEEDRA